MLETRLSIAGVALLAMLIGCSSGANDDLSPDDGATMDSASNKDFGITSDGPATDGSAVAADSPGSRPPDAGALGDAVVVPDRAVDASVVAACTKDSDCLLVDDCCTCAAIVRGDRPPACDPRITCPMTTCAQFGGVDKARCMAGRCIVGLDCDTTRVTCRRLAPVCPAGEVPRVVMQGQDRCYGECVDARQCLSVPECARCARGDLCVGYAAAAQVRLHCVSAPPPCGDSPSCACAAAICTGEWSSCVPGVSPLPQISCECPTCGGVL